MWKTLLAVFAVLALVLCTSRAYADGDATRGGALLVKKGCVSCHAVEPNTRPAA